MIDIAIQAALNAGQEILKIYNNPKSDFNIQLKADNSPLTMADRASHEIIIKYLAKTSFPILSEEGETITYKERKNWKTFWLIDPLDGTKEFIKRNDEFTVNIALIDNGIPIMGVIFVPVNNLLYVGDINLGAYKIENFHSRVTFENIKRSGFKLPDKTKQKIFTIVGSRSHMSPETQEYINNLKKNYGKIEILSKGSSLKICMVAEGKANEYPRFGPTMEWDTAAGHAIANAAGKKLWLTDLSNELQYNKKNLLNPHFIVK